MSDQLPKKSNFSEWYTEIHKVAKILDVRYPVKGFYAWHPFGYEMRNLVYNKLKELHVERGHREAQFPLLIPRKSLKKESEHVASFEEEVFWVERAGKNKLEEPLALRPTSETAMYPLFSEWIRSHTDLPLKVFQVVNTYRYETKHTRPLIREREISNFKEAHTVHEDMEEAEKQVGEAIEIYSEFFDDLTVPYTITKRPKWDKFPGSEYTIAFDTLMPDGKMLQIGTVHNLGRNFSETFDITFENEEGGHDHPTQTCFGISARSIASMIGIHGDDSGLVLPPKYAPVQIVIVPIIFSDSNTSEILETCSELKKNLEDEGLRVKLDDEDERPGKKFHKWEIKGVPVRIEVGPRDLEKDSATLVRRHNGEKDQVPLENIFTSVETLFDDISKNMRDNALKNLNEMVKFSTSLSDAKNMIEKGHAVEFYWCMEEKCGRQIEESLSADVLGERLDVDGEENIKKECIKCSSEAEKLALTARTY